MKQVFSEEIPQLLRPHLEQLVASGIDPEVVRERGYCSALGRAPLKEKGFSPAQQRAPGMLIPLWGVEGKVVTYQYRPDNPRLNSKGKPIKYENPAGSSARLDVPPRCRPLLGDPSIPVWFTEGVKKADALATAGACAVALTGVWNFKGRNPLGGTTVLADFDYIPLKGREAYVVYDSDSRHNPQVRRAQQRLQEHLRRKGEKGLWAVHLPSGAGGEKLGADDYLAQGHSLEDLKALAQPVEEEPGDKGREALRNFLFYDGRLYLEVRRCAGSYALACLSGGKVKFIPEVAIRDLTVRPRPLPQKDDGPLEIVGMADEGIADVSLLSPSDLFSKVKGHLARYVDLSELDLELCVYYVVFTWFSPKIHTLGYLRFLADTGKGKSRMLKAVGDLCFYPIFASGASTFSGMARLSNSWRGTLVVDEADLDGDKESQVIKFLNLGFERGKYYVLSDKENPKRQEFFDPFCPKILAMREPFHDNATEGRLLSISPHETSNPGIPILLPPHYSREVQTLRNELALFALHRWGEVDGTRMLDFSDLAIEPRLKQLAMPLSIVFQLWPDGIDIFKEYLVRRQKEVRRIRSLSWEGSLVNLVIAIASGDTELGEEFAPYYHPQSKKIGAVTPSMVARQFRSSVKAVTQSLVSVGFEVEKRYVTIYRENEEVRKQVRAYAVRDSRTWAEISGRYYYQEDERAGGLEIPEALMSSRFLLCPPASYPSYVSSPAAGKTDETDKTATHTAKDDGKPRYPCSACRHEDWWQRPDGGWVCGVCHPGPGVHDRGQLSRAPWDDFLAQVEGSPQ